MIPRSIIKPPDLVLDLPMQGEQLGQAGSLTTNGGFDADTDWTKGDGWSIAAGVASSDGSQAANSNLYQDMSLVIDKKYRMIFTISNYSAGTLEGYVGGNGPGIIRSANGTYTEDLICALDSIGYIQANADFIGDVDDVSYQELYTADVSGLGNHGRVDGATVAQGLYGSCYSFDGDDDIDCGNDSSLQITAAITVMGWVNAAAAANEAIASKHDFGAGQRAWLFNSSPIATSKIRVFLSDDGTSAAGHVKEYDSDITVFDSLWHHAAFTFDGSSLKLFVDGIEDGNVNEVKDDAITVIHNATVNMVIGAQLNNGAPLNGFDGSIDKIKVFNRALNEAQIRYEMYREAPLKPIINGGVLWPA